MKKEKPRIPQKVGIIISTFNQPEWLKKVLWGYSFQTRPADEIIIADDGSQPETRHILDEIKKKYDLPIKHIWQTDKGFRKNKIVNAAIMASESDYLIFTDQDCIPRQDFIESHLRLSRTGHFLSGGYFKIPMALSLKLTYDDIKFQRIFSLKWLLSSGIRWHFKCTKLIQAEWFNWFMNHFTTAKASWNGCNSSGWKSDLLRINGFDESLQYGGEDRELGERFNNLNIKGKQIRYSAICIHLDHERPYRDNRIIKANKKYRAKIRQHEWSRTPNGVYKVKNDSSLSVLPCKIFFLSMSGQLTPETTKMLQYAHYAKMSGDDVSVLTINESEVYRKAEELNLCVAKMLHPTPKVLFPWSFYQLYKFFKETRPDAVILNDSTDLESIGPSAAFAEVPLIAHLGERKTDSSSSLFHRFLYEKTLFDIPDISDTGFREIVHLKLSKHHANRF